MVATRFHNLIFALKLAKPTIALSYARKIDSLMGDLGLGEYCLPAGSIDVEALKALFTDVETPPRRDLRGNRESSRRALPGGASAVHRTLQRTVRELI